MSDGEMNVSGAELRWCEPCRSIHGLTEPCRKLPGGCCDHCADITEIKRLLQEMQNNRKPCHTGAIPYNEVT